MPQRVGRQASSHPPTRFEHASLLLYVCVGNLVVDACVDELKQAPHTALGWIRQRHAKFFQKGRHTSSCSCKFCQERDSGERTDVCPFRGGRTSQCDAAGARSSLFTPGVPIIKKLEACRRRMLKPAGDACSSSLAHQKRNLNGGSNPWG
jgi:hypothetical protein